jgi:hypothetical protein
MNPISSLYQQTALAYESDRFQRIRRARDAYEGRLPKPLKVRSGAPDDNVRLNFCRYIVDRNVAALWTDDFSIEIGGPDDQTGERYLDDVWPEHERRELLLDLATSGSIAGDVFVQIAIEDGRPRVVLLDPEGVTASWSPDDYRQVTSYVYQASFISSSGEAVAWRDRFERQSDGSWLIWREEGSTGRGYRPVGMQLEWRYPFPPILHIKNFVSPHHFYGSPDLTDDIIGLQYAIERVASLVNRIIRLHGYPKTIARGLAKTDLQIGVDGIIFLPNVDQQIENLEMQSDLSASLNFLRQLIERLALAASMPDLARTDQIGTAESGTALKIVYKPLLDRIATKRLFYGRLVRDIVSALLTIGGLERLASDITLHWGEPLPVNDAERLQIALLKQQLGISRQTILRELGYDPDAEAERRQAEQEADQTLALRAFDAGQVPLA